MALGIVLLDCNHKVLDRIDDPRNFLHRLLPPMDEQAAGLLSKIDWYGDTYFNYLQISKFMAEWAGLAERAESSDERELLARVNELAERCLRCRGLLHLVGD